MNLFEEALLEVNEEPSQMTPDGYELLYDLFSHLAEGGTIYDHPMDYLSPEVNAIFLAICMQTVARGMEGLI